jgi:hypothetical protein
MVLATIVHAAKLRGVRRFVTFCFADAEQFHRVLWLRGKPRFRFGKKFEVNFSSSSSFGARAVASRKANLARSAAVAPPSRTTRSASFRDASTKPLSRWG